MATGEGGEGERTDVLVLAGSDSAGPKTKKVSKAAANFFTPLSKKTKVAEVEQGKKVDRVEDDKDDDFQDTTTPVALAAIFEKKPAKKKAKKGKEEKKEVENASSSPDAQPGWHQPDCSPEQKQEVASLASDMKQPKESPAKKKRKQQQNVTESKPTVGVHGPDLRMQARLAAEENARLSAGKAPHPFFARPKSGGAKSLVMDEAGQSPGGQSLHSAHDSAEGLSQASPVKPPHPFFARQKLGGGKAMTVDETSNIYECDSLFPCVPFHITQNLPEEETKLTRYSDWTRHNVPVIADGEKIEEKWSFSTCQPIYTWSWPSWDERNRQSESISKDAAFGRVISYLTAKKGTQYLLSEEVKSGAANVEKLVEKFSSYYYTHAKKFCPEQISAVQPCMEEKHANSSRNPLWTDHYQPQISQEICGNKESVRSLSMWFQNWREKILQQRGVATKSKEMGDGSDFDDSDFEDSPSDVDDDNEDLPNCHLVTGPIGCGKSAAIYACAMEQGFTVIEVNASECRNGALIRHKFKEAMESHGLSNRQSSTPMNASNEQVDAEQFLKQGLVCQRNIFQDGNSESQLLLSQNASRSNLPPPSLRGLRVILFEDVDTVFEEDSGFMGALGLLARTSKCPIIFSSNSQDPVLPHVRHLQVIRFEQPSTAELVAHALMICMAEGVACSPDIVEYIVKAIGHDLRKLLMLLQFWTQRTPFGSRHWKDADAVDISKEQRTDKQYSVLVDCLLQLDGCPGVPATRIHAVNQKLNTANSGGVEHEELCGQKARLEHLETGELESSRTYKEVCLDSERLFAYDCQHRILPLLFLRNEPCELTSRVSERLKEAAEKVVEMSDDRVAAWFRRRFDMLKAKAEAEAQARKALRKLQVASQKETIGSLCRPRVTDRDQKELLQDKLEAAGEDSIVGPDADTMDSHAINGLGDRADVLRPVSGGIQTENSDRPLSDILEILKSPGPLVPPDKRGDSLSTGKTDAFLVENIFGQCETLSKHSTNQQAMKSQDDGNFSPPESFSFIKLMQSSYDSPAAQNAIKECNEDTWSILQGSSSPEECDVDTPPACLFRDKQMHGVNSSGATETGIALEKDEPITSLLEDGSNRIIDMTSVRSSNEAGQILCHQHCSAECHSDASLSERVRSSIPPQKHGHLSAAAAEAHTHSTCTGFQDSVPPRVGAGKTICVNTSGKEGNTLSSPIPDNFLTIHHDLDTQFSEGEHSTSQDASLDLQILTSTCDILNHTWAELRASKLHIPLLEGLDDSVLLDDVLFDLSACDILFNRTSAAAKDPQAFIDPIYIGSGGYAEESSRDGCAKSATFLAQLLFKQALNGNTPLNHDMCDSCQVGPSICQQECRRQEERDCEDELLDSLVPQRCRILGALGRVDYMSFHSQLTTRPAAGAEVVRIGPTTRQRKNMLF